MNIPSFTLKSLMLAVACASFFMAGFTCGVNFHEPVTEVRTMPFDEPCCDNLFFYNRDFEDHEFISDFRQLIGDTLLTKKRHGQALSMLLEVNVDELIKNSPPNSYIAVSEAELIDGTGDCELLGTNIEFDQRLDWVIPESDYRGNSDQWIHFSRAFSRKYNRRLEELGFGRQAKGGQETRKGTRKREKVRGTNGTGLSQAPFFCPAGEFRTQSARTVWTQFSPCQISKRILAP